MAEECKYRLPCNWCDKHDRQCDVVLFELEFKESKYRHLMEKYQQDANAQSIAETNKIKNAACNHAWYFDSYIDDINGRTEKHVCNYCGEVKYVQTKIGI